MRRSSMLPTLTPQAALAAWRIPRPNVGVVIERRRSALERRRQVATPTWISFHRGAVRVTGDISATAYGLLRLAADQGALQPRDDTVEILDERLLFVER